MSRFNKNNNSYNPDDEELFKHIDKFDKEVHPYRGAGIETNTEVNESLKRSIYALLEEVSINEVRAALLSLKNEYDEKNMSASLFLSYGVGYILQNHRFIAEQRKHHILRFKVNEIDTFIYNHKKIKASELLFSGDDMFNGNKSDIKTISQNIKREFSNFEYLCPQKNSEEKKEHALKSLLALEIKIELNKYLKYLRTKTRHFKLQNLQEEGINAYSVNIENERDVTTFLQEMKLETYQELMNLFKDRDVFTDQHLGIRIPKAEFKDNRAKRRQDINRILHTFIGNPFSWQQLHPAFYLNEVAESNKLESKKYSSVGEALRNFPFFPPKELVSASTQIKLAAQKRFLCLPESIEGIGFSPAYLKSLLLFKPFPDIDALKTNFIWNKETMGNYINANDIKDICFMALRVLIISQNPSRFLQGLFPDMKPEDVIRVESGTHIALHVEKRIKKLKFITDFFNQKNQIGSSEALIINSIKNLLSSRHLDQIKQSYEKLKKIASFLILKPSSHYSLNNESFEYLLGLPLFPFLDHGFLMEEKNYNATGQLKSWWIIQQIMRRRMVYRYLSVDKSSHEILEAAIKKQVNLVDFGQFMSEVLLRNSAFILNKMSSFNKQLSVEVLLLHYLKKVGNKQSNNK